MGNSNARTQPKRTTPEFRADARCRLHTTKAGSAKISHTTLRANSILGADQWLPAQQKLYPQLSEDVDSKFPLR
jgi:hypothetical protein